MAILPRQHFFLSFTDTYLRKNIQCLELQTIQTNDDDIAVTSGGSTGDIRWLEGHLKMVMTCQVYE